MSDFVPDGYLQIDLAVNQALRHWFGEHISAAMHKIDEDLARADETYSSTDPIPDHLEEFIRQKLEEACQEQIEQTRHDLRNALHKGQITAVYFSTTILRDEPNSIPRGFWTSPSAGDVIKYGIYFPFGRPQAFHERRPSEQVLVREDDLKRLLAGEASMPDAEAVQPREDAIAAPAGERYLTPYIDLMLQAIDNFAISAARWPKKEELLEWFLTQKLPDGTPITKNQAEMMATFARPPEASRGGNKRS